MICSISSASEALCLKHLFLNPLAIIWKLLVWKCPWHFSELFENVQFLSFTVMINYSFENSFCWAVNFFPSQSFLMLSEIFFLLVFFMFVLSCMPIPVGAIISRKSTGSIKLLKRTKLYYSLPVFVFPCLVSLLSFMENYQEAFSFISDIVFGWMTVRLDQRAQWWC